MSASAGSAAPLVAAMGAVARELLGEPTEVNEAKRELRFGTRGSLAVNLENGTYYDNEIGDGGGVLKLVQVRKLMDKAGAVAWLQERGHLPKATASSPTGKRQVATYDYLDANGALRFQVVRFDPKDFRQRAPDGNGGWVWKMAGVQRVPYRLPAVIETVAAGRTVYVAEGEKGVHALESIGLVGTNSPGGAGKWWPEYNSIFVGADVVILPDNDPQTVLPDGTLACHPDGKPKLAGQDHAANVARHLHGIAKRVRVVMLPNLPLKGDVADWIAAGGTRDQLEELAAAMPDWVPTQEDNCGTSHNSRSEGDLNGFDLTEDGIALAFAKKHQNDLRFDHTRGAWFQWTGVAWRQDETKRAFSWARQRCREMAKAADAKDKQLVTLAKAATAAAVERFAQSDPGLAVTSVIWDQDAYLLGTPGGTVDLRTAELRAPVIDDHITKLAAVTPSATPDCPQWLVFLDQVTKGDTALIAFLKQWCGYCLTGDTREHALLFAHGLGGNGKGVFLNTVAGIMGNYATTAAMDCFTASTNDRHPTDLAMLRGARLVSASETEDGQAWAESRIKQLTGGDPITARFMRMDFFTFKPSFKLTIIGNHQPILRNVDEAARRRINMAPFVFKPPVKDMQLETKLRQEWPGILRWMIEGCLDWQQNGLIRPEVVKTATDTYFSEQDIVHQWVEECCDMKGYDTLAVLFKSWTDYALANGEKPGTTKWFSQTLARLGCRAVKSTPGHRGKRGFIGISVNLEKPADWTAPTERDDDEPPF